MAVETVKKKLFLPIPDPTKVTLLPPKNLTQDVADDLKEFVGPVKAIILYGSDLNGTASLKSRKDVIVVADDIEEFHQRSLDLHPEIYGLPHDSGYHAFWDQFGLTYYRADINNRTSTRWKIVVISSDNLNTLGRGGFQLGFKVAPTNPFEIALQGRFQKYSLGEVDNVPDDVKTVIDQSRLIGMTQVLGLLPKKFSLDQAEQTYIGWSYKTDIRLEQPDKIEKIKSANQSGYDLMVADLLKRLDEVGLVEQLGEDQYMKLYKPNTKALGRIILEARAAAVFSNYIKNVLTGGMGSSLIYAKEKAERALIRRWEIMMENKDLPQIFQKQFRVS